MKKATLTVLTLALVGLLAVGAWAAGPYYGGGYGGRGYCAGAQATGPVDREAAAKFRRRDPGAAQGTCGSSAWKCRPFWPNPKRMNPRCGPSATKSSNYRPSWPRKANQAGLAAGYGRGYGKSYGQGRGQGHGYGRGGYGQSNGACWR